MIELMVKAEHKYRQCITLSQQRTVASINWNVTRNLTNQTQNQQKVKSINQKANTKNKTFMNSLIQSQL